MKFLLTKTSNREFEKVIEISTLEELLLVVKKYAAPLIINELQKDDEFPCIEIYDDYRE